MPATGPAMPVLSSTTRIPSSGPTVHPNVHAPRGSGLDSGALQTERHAAGLRPNRAWDMVHVWEVRGACSRGLSAVQAECVVDDAGIGSSTVRMATRPDRQMIQGVRGLPGWLWSRA